MKATVKGKTVFREQGDFSPFPVAVRAGEFVFAPCVVNLAAADPRPLDTWRSRHESKIVLDRLETVMKLAGGGLEHVVNLLQTFDGRGQTAGYVEERRGYFGAGVPTSTGTAATRLATPSALIQLDATGIIPASGVKFAYLGGTSKNASYSNALSYGDLVYYSGVMTNAPETRLDPELWFGSAVKNEIRFIMQKKLAAVLKDAECTVDDIAVANFHLLNPQDDFGPLNEVTDELFPGKKPVFTVSPSSGLGSLPGRIEISPIAVRKGGATVVEDIAPAGMPAGILGGPQAKRVGNQLHISTQFAGDRYGLLREVRIDPRNAHLVNQTAVETEWIVNRIAAICAAAGTDAKSLVRLRLYARDMADARTALLVVRQRLGDDIAVSVTEDAGAGDWLGGCSISADAIAWLG